MGIISPTQAPVGPAGGSLAGTYPNPEFAAKSVTSPKLAAELTVEKGLGMYNKAPPGAQPANPNEGGFSNIPGESKVEGFTFKTKVEFEKFVKSMEKVMAILKELGFSA